MNKKVVFILSDAFRYDYVFKHDLAFLKQKVMSNQVHLIENIHPSTGFCEIVEYVTGQSSLEHGLLSQITVSHDWFEKKSPFYIRFLGFVFRMAFFKRIRKIRGVFQLIMEYLLSFSSLPKEMLRVRYNIPPHFLPFLVPTESKYAYDSPDFFGSKNLFCWMKSNNIQYDLDGFVKYNKVVGTDQDRMNELLQKVESDSLKDFTLIYLGVGELAHFLSMDDPKFIEAMQVYDRNVASIYSALVSSDNDFELVLLGDHGMVPVSSYINIEPHIHRIAASLNLTLFKDYMYFIDSTMVRIWIKDTSLVSPFESELFQVIGESLETTGDIFGYLDAFKPDYGNVIALLKPGVCFYPDFFNNRKNVGMHGYLNTNHYQSGVLFRFGPNVVGKTEASLELKDVSSFIMDEIYDR
tara:strand:- start:1565 stop:2791 length:1227 start_codon:yes stop_codon:yes gene_type:complete